MSKKKLPKGVPEENIYNKAHLLISVSYTHLTLPTSLAV